MQACLYEHLFYEWTIWRMPYSEKKRSGFELAFRLIYIRRMPNSEMERSGSELMRGANVNIKM